LASRSGRGDEKAAKKVLPMVYEGLRRVVAQTLAKELPDQTFQATA
jgi:hypothetical protein